MPASYGTDRLSSRRRQAHPSHLAGSSYTSPGWYRRPSREILRSEHSFPRRRAAGSHLPAGQRHDPHADASHTTEVHGGPQGKENLNGSCENMNQFPPKRQHNLRVLKDSQYSGFLFNYWTIQEF